MGRTLPPLNAVKSFEVAARYCSFVAAAEELCVTPGAVSQQVRLIEDWLGVELFVRHHKRIELTHVGERYRNRLGPILDQLSAATIESLRESRTRLRVCCLAAFADCWLASRLSQFSAQHPNIDVDLIASDGRADFDRHPADIWVGYGPIERPGIKTAEFLREEVFPVCSPALCEGPRALKRPEDLRHHRLLHDVGWRNDWALWAYEAGIDRLRLDGGQSFTLYSMVLKAAVAGSGVAMGHSALAAADINCGRLVAPFDIRVPAPHVFHVSSPASAKFHAPRSTFLAWLFAATKCHSRPATPVTGKLA